MPEHLLLVLRHGKPLDMRTYAIDSLCYSLDRDPSLEVRLSAVHGVCDLLYEDATFLPPRLIRSVGRRVGSKNKNERRDAVTGLARVYFKKYLKERVKFVIASPDGWETSFVEGGSGSDMDELAEYMSNNLSHLECQFGFLPQIILESACFTDATDSDMRSRVIQILDDILLGNLDDTSLPTKANSATQRSIGVSIICQSLSGNAVKWLQTLLHQRSQLQRLLSSYIDSRAQLRRHKFGSEDYLRTDAAAIQHLKKVSTLLPPCRDDTMDSIVKDVHSIKDKHVFRLLGTISLATHSPSARHRALDDLPKRIGGMGSGTATWLKTLAKRAAMGGSFNGEVMRQCLVLAGEQLAHARYECVQHLLKPVDIMSHAFPEVIGQEFEVLVSLLEGVRGVKKGRTGREVEERGLLGTVLGIMARGAAEGVKVLMSLEPNASKSIQTEFKSTLLRLVTTDATETQTRHAITILSAIQSQSSNGGHAHLIRTLTRPSRLNIENDRINCILAALAELIDGEGVIPKDEFFEERIERAVEFSMNVVLGKDQESYQSTDDERETRTDEEDNVRQVTRKRKSKAVVEEPTLSPLAVRITSSIDFLVSYTRALVTYHQQNIGSKSHIPPFYNTLVTSLSSILTSSGQPSAHPLLPSTDLPSVRLTTSIALLHLSSTSLKLPPLPVPLWHTLGQSYTDSSSLVREGLFHHWNNMICVRHPFHHAPSLRFLAYIVLAPSNSGATDYSSASNKIANAAKTAAHHCIDALRRTCESTMAQCRALSPQAEEHYDRKLKMRLMPEFSLPFALHLLTFWEEDDEVENNAESGKLLKKRLKWLLEPLIESLGEGAENIGFLLRMVEILGEKHCAIPPKGSENKGEGGKRLRLVCHAARDVLISFVKKDVNLTPYPGAIPIPHSLFRRIDNTNTKRKRKSNDEVTKAKKAKKTTSKEKTDSTRRSSLKKRQPFLSPGEKSHVTFSENVQEVDYSPPQEENDPSHPDNNDDVEYFSDPDFGVITATPPTRENTYDGTPRIESSSEGVSWDEMSPISNATPSPKAERARRRLHDNETVEPSEAGRSANIGRIPMIDNQENKVAVKGSSDVAQDALKTKDAHVVSASKTKTPRDNDDASSDKENVLESTNKALPTNPVRNNSETPQLKSDDDTSSTKRKRKEVAPVQIKVNCNSKTAGTDSSKPTMKKRRKKKTDEFDFDDDEDDDMAISEMLRRRQGRALNSSKGRESNGNDTSPLEPSSSDESFSDNEPRSRSQKQVTQTHNSSLRQSPRLKRAKRRGDPEDGVASQSPSHGNGRPVRSKNKSKELRNEEHEDDESDTSTMRSKGSGRLSAKKRSAKEVRRRSTKGKLIDSNDDSDKDTITSSVRAARKKAYERVSKKSPKARNINVKNDLEKSSEEEISDNASEKSHNRSRLIVRQKSGRKKKGLIDGSNEINQDINTSSTRAARKKVNEKLQKPNKTKEGTRRRVTPIKDTEELSSEEEEHEVEDESDSVSIRSSDRLSKKKRSGKNDTRRSRRKNGKHLDSFDDSENEIASRKKATSRSSRKANSAGVKRKSEEEDDGSENVSRRSCDRFSNVKRSVKDDKRLVTKETKPTHDLMSSEEEVDSDNASKRSSARLSAKERLGKDKRRRAGSSDKSVNNLTKKEQKENKVTKRCVGHRKDPEESSRDDESDNRSRRSSDRLSAKTRSTEVDKLVLGRKKNELSNVRDESENDNNSSSGREVQKNRRSKIKQGVNNVRSRKANESSQEAAVIDDAPERSPGDFRGRLHKKQSSAREVKERSGRKQDRAKVDIEESDKDTSAGRARVSKKKSNERLSRKTSNNDDSSSEKEASPKKKHANTAANIKSVGRKGLNSDTDVGTIASVSKKKTRKQAKKEESDYDESTKTSTKRKAKKDTPKSAVTTTRSPSQRSTRSSSQRSTRSKKYPSSLSISSESTELPTRKKSRQNKTNDNSFTLKKSKKMPQEDKGNKSTKTKQKALAVKETAEISKQSPAVDKRRSTRLSLNSEAADSVEEKKDGEHLKKTRPATESVKAQRRSNRLDMSLSSPESASSSIISTSELLGVAPASKKIVTKGRKRQGRSAIVSDESEVKTHGNRNRPRKRQKQK